jgi:hypothetical protein
VLRRSVQDCSAYTLSFDTTVFIIGSTRRRVAVEATLENRGENAYSTVLNISQSANLQFASLIQKVRSGRPASWPNPKTEKERKSPGRLAVKQSHLWSSNTRGPFCLLLWRCSGVRLQGSWESGVRL